MFDIEQTILDGDGETVATAQSKQLMLAAGDSSELTNVVSVADPKLWSIETPHLHRLVTTIRTGGAVVDQYETPFGISSIRFDPNEGSFLDGEHAKLKGTDNHQDHAGVGTAIPDALQEFRIARPNEFGCNAYRASHNPPTPQLLDACDRLGMVVIDENRLMGVTDYHFDHLKRLILRDRNHPSVILWSLGNEEWRIEGNEQSSRIAAAMQAFVWRLDPTRLSTLASSGSWGRGYSIPIDVMGFNYYTHGNTDEYHAQFPNKPSVGTEECATFSTRGVYVENRERAHLTAYDKNSLRWDSLAEQGWNHHAAPTSPASLSGPALIIAASRLLSAGLQSTLNLASSIRVDSSRITLITTSLGGRTNPCSICCCTGTGWVRKAKTLKSGATAIARRLNCSSIARARAAKR